MTLKRSMQRTDVQLSLIAMMALAAAACGIDKQTAPALTGPSEFAKSITVTASPDIVNRDGESKSVIRIVARGPNGALLPNETLRLDLSPSNGGSLSAAEVRTDSNGQASAVFTAPPLDTVVSTVHVAATPVGGDFAAAVSRWVSIGLAAPDAAVPSFVYEPDTPEQFELVTFDASATTLGGTPCGDRCTYEWNWGGEGTQTGQVVTYRFQREYAYNVTLTVRSPGGVTTKTQQSVRVGTPTLPTPAFTFSPTDPIIGGTVRFDARSSEAAAGSGATIVEYTWDFGNGQTATGPLASTTFPSAQTYVVRLTVRDSNGLTATTTQGVGVKEPEQ